MKRTVLMATALALLIPAAVAAQGTIENPEAGRKFNEGKALFQQGQYQEALTLLLESAELEAGNYQAHYMLGLTYARLRQYDEALAQHEAALRFNPNYYLVHFAMGNIYRDAKNDPEKAIEHFQQAGAISEQFQQPYWRAFFNLGSTTFQLERWDDALQAFNKVTQYEPTNEQAFEMMGRCYVEKGDYQNAIMQFQNAANRKPTWYEPHFYQANVLNRMGNYDQAIAAADRALELMPGNGGALYEKGLALKNKQQWDPALAVLQEAARDVQWRQMAEYQMELIRNRDAYVNIPPDTSRTRIPPVL